MKTRTVQSDGETLVITEHEPLRCGNAILYRSNTCRGRSSNYPNGVLRFGSKYIPVRTITDPHDNLLEAICEICGRYDIVGIAWALGNFNLTLDDCLKENAKTSDIILEKSQLNMEGYPTEQVEAVKKMAEAMTDKDRYSVLYECIMRAVKSGALTK